MSCDAELLAPRLPLGTRPVRPTQRGFFMIEAREHARRFLCGLPRRLWALCAAVGSLLAVLLLLMWCMRIVTITTSDGLSHTVFAPLKAGHGYTFSLVGLSIDVGDEVLLQDDPKEGRASLHLEEGILVNVTADGQARSAYIAADTVGEALEDFGITLGPDDYTEPSLDSECTENISITVHRVEYRDYTIQEVLPFETVVETTSVLRLTPDKELVVQEGVDGYLHADARDRIVDGEVESTELLTVYEEVAPVAQVVKRYEAGKAVSSVTPPAECSVVDNVPVDAAASGEEEMTVYTMKATGYYSARGKGASGLGLYYGTVAIDPNLIPYGSLLYITSEDGSFVYGWAIATDTGAFVQNDNMHVDLFYESYEESAANAVGEVLVYVVREGEGEWSHREGISEE